MDVLDVTALRDVGNAVHEIVGVPCSLRSTILSSCAQIDWEESVHANCVSVRPNIDEELDNWKHIYDGIDGVLVGSFPYKRILIVVLNAGVLSHYSLALQYKSARPSQQTMQLL